MNISRFRPVVLALLVPLLAHGQTVDSGSDGREDGFNQAINILLFHMNGDTLRP